MIELVIIDYLESALNVPVSMEEPNKTGPHIVIERIGSSERNMINKPSFAIQSYGETLYEAATLNERLKEAMKKIMFSKTEITKCTCETDYNFTDTSTKKYRYQAIFEITHY